MIVVIGSPASAASESHVIAAGLAASIARAVAARGVGVQLVGRVGDDATGDEVLIDLAAAEVGHVAILRTAGTATPTETIPVRRDETSLGDSVSKLADDLSASDAVTEAPRASEPGLPVDAGDLDLALRYLPDYRVIVVAVELDEAGWRSIAAAGAWSGASIIAVIASGSPPPATIPDGATVLERPASDGDAAFAGLVGRYAAELDRGTEPRAAFAAATAGAGWATVEAERD